MTSPTNYAAQGTQRALEFERMLQDQAGAAELLQSPLVQSDPPKPRRRTTWGDVGAFVGCLLILAAMGIAMGWWLEYGSTFFR